MRITRREMLASGLAAVASAAIPLVASERKPDLIVSGEIAMTGFDASGYAFSKDCLKSMLASLNGNKAVPISYRAKKIIDGHAISGNLCGEGNTIRAVVRISDQEFLSSGIDILNSGWWLVPSITTILRGKVCSKTELVNLILTPEPADKRLFPIHKFK